MSEPRHAPRLLAAALASLAGVAFTAIAYVRYATYHNGNFDLAFYARMAWGLARGDSWQPLVDADNVGLHVTPITNLLGLVGRATFAPTVPLLLAAQCLAVALTVWPLARIAERHVGRWGALLAAAVWLFHPNLGHVASYDFHPGTVAVLPLAWACEAVDARSVRRYVLALAGVMLCREDLVVPAALLGLLLAVSLRRRRSDAEPDGGAAEVVLRASLARWTWLVPLVFAAVALAYLAVWALVIHPRHAPEVGSLELHFGRFGSSPGAVALHLVEHPLEAAGEVLARGRAGQLPLLLLPLAFVPLLSPRWLLPVTPILLLNMLSAWPNSQGLYTHYATPALPMLATAALVGAGKLATWTARRPRVAATLAALPALAAACGHALVGGTPASIYWDRAAMLEDDVTRDARAIVARIPADESVQAPDRMLAHLAERVAVHRAPPPERRTLWVALDVRHRLRLARRGDLLRSTEEPLVRFMLERHAVVVARPRFLLFRRGRSPRAGVARRYLREAFGAARLPSPVRLTACLSLVAAGAFAHRDREGPAALGLAFRAHGPCAIDLAIRLSPVMPLDRIDPARAINDLPCDGLLSPGVLRDGDALWSVHEPIGPSADALARDGLLVGLVRESGARPEPDDPTWVHVPVRPLPGRPPPPPWGGAGAP